MVVVGERLKISDTLAYKNSTEIVEELTQRIKSVMESYSKELEKDSNIKTYIDEDCLFVRFNDGSQLETSLGGSFQVRTKEMREANLNLLKSSGSEWLGTTLESWRV